MSYPPADPNSTPGYGAPLPMPPVGADPSSAYGAQPAYSVPQPPPPPAYGQPYAPPPPPPAPYGQQPYGAAPVYMPPQPAGPPKPSPIGEFFKALFTFNFKVFVTPKILSILYVLIVVLVGLAFIVGLVTSIGAAIAASQFGGGAAGAFGVLVYVVAGAIGVVVTLALMRVTLEFFAATIQTAENTAKAAEHSQSIAENLSQEDKATTEDADDKSAE